MTSHRCRALRTALVFSFAAVAMSETHAQTFTIEQVLSAPFASYVTAANEKSRFAWVSNQAGRRNIWVSDVTGAAAALTHYTADDGIDLSELSFVPHHEQLLFVRGGDVEYPDKPAPNPAALSQGVTQEIVLGDLATRELQVLTEGHSPQASPDGSFALFLRGGGVFRLGLTKGAKAEPLFKLRGAVTALSFSPSGDAVAFVSDRGDHSFIGVYRFADGSVRWLDASFDFDFEPRWSPDGGRIAFLRAPSTHDDIEIISHHEGQPWSIRVWSALSGQAQEVYKSPRGAGSVFHPLSSAVQLMWSGNGLIFPAENDGWLHLYSVPAGGGAAHLLTPGGFEVEYASASVDGRSIVFASNAGDIDRRHLWRLLPATGKIEALTHGSGIETQPAVLSDGESVAFLKSDAQVTAHAALLKKGSAPVDLFAEGLPSGYPAKLLQTPESVSLPLRAGIAAHGVLFKPVGGRSEQRHPALVFMHGGPVRQMLTGWHYMDYYSNAYAFNQYLASRGYVVLALNYRAGIGYGLDFREAANVGAGGASEYNDVLAAAQYLNSRPDVDAKRIGLWGGSYGGYLTALGLARDSAIFKAGVDLHGVHDWHHWTLGERDNRPLYVQDTSAEQLSTAFAASPMASISQWHSPVLLIQGDDDHNVSFNETVRLAEALRSQGVEYSQLVFPDEIHGFLRHDSWLRAYQATVEFFDKKL
jgi:dipeptidyl aminopeptidase/acylaminoacyl peptidase